MVGFSDGTKDGGYFMANWSIYRAKEELTAVSKQYGIDVFFLTAGEVLLPAEAEKHISFMHPWVKISLLKKFIYCTGTNSKLQFWYH